MRKKTLSFIGFEKWAALLWVGQWRGTDSKEMWELSGSLPIAREKMEVYSSRHKEMDSANHPVEAWRQIFTQTIIWCDDNPGSTLNAVLWDTTVENTAKLCAQNSDL